MASRIRKIGHFTRTEPQVEKCITSNSFADAGNASLCTSRFDNALKIGFSATVGDEPEIEVTLV
jgi:hypothetical protein